MEQQLLTSLWGLGVFLFGMLYLEEALEKAAGNRLKIYLKRATDSIPKSILTGALSTAILQSSSIVTLLTLSFVSVSMITLQNGIGVIFGANLGTTMTAWLVALLGFKFSIEAFALPIAGIGGLLMVFFTEDSKLYHGGKFMIGFGLLFLGLDYMKSGIEAFSASFDMSSYTNLPLYYFVVIGLVITALIQSSSATTALILSSLSAGVIGFEQGAALMIGANIGTTVTALLGALGGVVDKKRVAVAHTVFNLLTALGAYLMLPYLSQFILVGLNMSGEYTSALALFHTLFNLLGILALSGFIPLLAKLLQKLIKTKKSIITRYIHLADPTASDAALIATIREVSGLYDLTQKYILLCANINAKNLLIDTQDTQMIVDNNVTIIDFNKSKGYKHIKTLESEIFDYITKINANTLNEMQSMQIDKLFNATRECGYAARLAKDMKNNFDEFASNEESEVRKYYNEMRRNILHALRHLLRLQNAQIAKSDFDTHFSSVIKENEILLKEMTIDYRQHKLPNHTITTLLNTNRSIFLMLHSLQDVAQAFELYE